MIRYSVAMEVSLPSHYYSSEICCISIYCDSNLLCCVVVHPGLSPDMNDFDQIRSIARPTDVPDTGLLCDLLWSDPDKDMQGWGENDRGVSFTFGSDIVTKFLNRHDLDLICRAHQVRKKEREREREPCH